LLILGVLSLATLMELLQLASSSALFLLLEAVAEPLAAALSERPSTKKDKARDILVTNASRGTCTRDVAVLLQGGGSDSDSGASCCSSSQAFPLSRSMGIVVVVVVVVMDRSIV
jgi:hypothetical protein